MICRFVMLAAFALLPGMVLEGQTAGGEHLYFLSATPGTRANAGLFRLEAGRTTPQLVRRVAPAVDMVLADYDRRKLVVVSPEGPDGSPHIFNVVDMLAPVTQRHARIDYDRMKFSPIGIYLLDVPSRGLTAAMTLSRVADEFEPPSTLTAVTLSTSPASSDLPLEDSAFLRIGGFVGGAVQSFFEGIPSVHGNPAVLLIGALQRRTFLESTT
jgi:hypothetical protein